MKKNKLNIVLIINFTLIVLLTILLKFVNVKFNNITSSYIGLYNINKLFINNYNNNLFNTLSDFIFIIALLIISIIYLILIINYIKYKKINKRLFIYQLLIIIMFIVWIVFDNLIIVNFRPILIDGIKEGSYPSTHVMVSCFVFLSLYELIKDKINKKYNKVIFCLIIILILLISIFRILSLMHWFTDVLSGLLFGIFFYLCFIKINKLKE